MCKVSIVLFSLYNSSAISTWGAAVLWLCTMIKVTWDLLWQRNGKSPQAFTTAAQPSRVYSVLRKVNYERHFVEPVMQPWITPWVTVWVVLKQQTERQTQRLQSVLIVNKGSPAEKNNGNETINPIIHLWDYTCMKITPTLRCMITAWSLLERRAHQKLWEHYVFCQWLDM